MIADQLQGIEKFEADLWKIADNLRANSNLASNEYFMPIMGLIFLRHATNRFYEAKSAIEADKAAGKTPDRPLVVADFTRRRALDLPESARFDVILKTPKDGDLGAALNAAMEAIETAFPPLAGQLPDLGEARQELSFPPDQETWANTYDVEAGPWSLRLAGTVVPTPQLMISLHGNQAGAPPVEPFLTLVRRAEGFGTVNLDSSGSGTIALPVGDSVMLLQADEVWEVRLSFREWHGA
jgi:hypothetical protein